MGTKNRVTPHTIETVPTHKTHCFPFACPISLPIIIPRTAPKPPSLSHEVPPSLSHEVPNARYCWLFSEFSTKKPIFSHISLIETAVWFVWSVCVCGVCVYTKCSCEWRSPLSSGNPRWTSSENIAFGWASVRLIVAITHLFPKRPNFCLVASGTTPPIMFHKHTHTRLVCVCV